MALLSLILSIGLCALVSGQPTAPLNGWTYKIEAFTTYCLVVENYSMENNAVTETSVCDGDIALWIAKSLPNFPGYVNLVNKYTGKCLSSGIDLSGADNDTPVLQYACQPGGSYAQLWWVDPASALSLSPDPSVGFQYWAGLRGNGGRCLTYRDVNGGWKGQLYLYDCDTRAHPNQRFRFVQYSQATSD